MTPTEVKNLIHLIRAYYPTKKILDSPLEVMVWEDEFVTYDKDTVIDATRELCRTTENNFDISIASIKNYIKDKEKSQKDINDTQQYLLECEERENLIMSESTKKKIQETLKSFRRNSNE